MGECGGRSELNQRLTSFGPTGKFRQASRIDLLEAEIEEHLDGV